MPRILPRLLARISSEPLTPTWTPFVLPRTRPKSLHKPVPDRPSLHPDNHKTSILLDEPDTNPITASRVYIRHKTLPPLPRRVRRRRKDGNDSPRGMTEQECQWWSSPYLRMLASPIRKCIATERYLPTDFLIRLAPMVLPASLPRASWVPKGTKQTFIPDGLQHSQFTVRKSGKATYILCNRSAVPIVADPSNRGARGVSVHPLLADHIAHLLRLRVLQELELLADALDSRTRHKLALPARIIRRLTRAEWDALRSTGTIPYPNALAVLVVPPLQKDPRTKLRPQPSMSAAPLPPDPTLPSSSTPSTQNGEKKIPLCTLHPVAPAAWGSKVESEPGGGIVPEARVPLYNGVALFPAKPQRAALHALLTRLLGIERRSRHSRLTQTDGGQVEERQEEVKGGRASHAFVLCGDKETVLRGDVTAVAIALWRVRMFEDEGEDVAALWEGAGGWERTAPTRL